MQWIYNLCRSFVVSIAILPIVLCFHGAHSAMAQETNRPGYIERTKLDVQVMLAPLPTGDWMVTEVYPAQVPHAQVAQRVNQLLSLTGWKATGISYEDYNMGLNKADGEALDATRDPVMSSASFNVAAKIIDTASGTIDVTPFALSLRDLNHINLTYMVPDNFGFKFRGLTQFENSILSLNLVRGQGTYTYVMNIKNHAFSSLSLPKDDGASIAERQTPSHGSRVFGTTLIVALALGVGVLVYFWATRISSGGESTSSDR